MVVFFLRTILQTFLFIDFLFPLRFTRDWSRKHIFIIFEGLSSQIVSQLWTKHYTHSVFIISGQGDPIAAVFFFKFSRECIFRDEETPEMHFLGRF